MRSGELSTPLGISAKQERYLLSRMEGAGLIARVQRGLYLVPQRLPLGGRWSPDEALALNTLMAEHNGQYQICGPGAFNRYGFDEQVPTRVYVYNNRLSGNRMVGAVALSMIKVSDDRLGATEEVATGGDGAKAIYSSRVRSLVDAVRDWSWFDTLPRAFEWIKNELESKRVAADELISMTLRFGNSGTTRRMGALLESQKVSKSLLLKLERGLVQSKSLVSWVPNRSRRGSINKRWGVVLNG